MVTPQAQSKGERRGGHLYLKAIATLHMSGAVVTNLT